MGKRDKFHRGLKPDKLQQQGGKGDKPTHFLCFPIASDTTVPLISGSLRQWRDVTTMPSKKPRIRATISEGASTSSNLDATPPVKDEVTPNSQRPTMETFEESLKVLPPIVTRAAGTWHLTLGVMNLEEKTRMQKALQVLHDLDLQGLLRDAGKGPPESYKPARKWRDEENGEGAASIGADREHSTDQDRVKSKEAINQTQQPLDPITIALTGLGSFPSLAKARVLWARPREQSSPANSTNRPVLGDSQRLYNFALHLIQPFRDAGLITETRPLALHATVANMRFFKSREKLPVWKKNQVYARKIGAVWNEYGGDVSAAVSDGVEDEADGGSMHQEANSKDEDDVEDEEENGIRDASKEFVWLKDVSVNRVAICKLGALNHEDPLWGQWYPAIEDGERSIFEIV